VYNLKMKKDFLVRVVQINPFGMPMEFHGFTLPESCTFNDDGSVDTHSGFDINMVGTDLTNIPVKFRNINGSFDCSFCHLKSLDMFPSKVLRSVWFLAQDNKYTTEDILRVCDCYMVHI